MKSIQQTTVESRVPLQVGDGSRRQDGSRDFSHSASLMQTVADMTQPIFKYQGHRTTRTGSLVLSFMEISTCQEVVFFFNSDIRRKRGNERGRCYPSGKSGQFWPPEVGKFRNFWLREVGSPPRRWAATHKELRPRLGSMQFTADVIVAQRSNGTRYLKGNNLRSLNKTLAQAGTATKHDENNEITHAGQHSDWYGTDQRHDGDHSETLSEQDGKNL